MAIYLAPTKNFVQTTLNGAITNSATTITLNSTANLQSPGYIVVDRVDANGTSTPSAREVISYTGISSNDLTGCTRGADGSTASAHSSGAIVETTPVIGMWNNMATAISQFADSNGYITAINSPVSIAIGNFKTISVNSIASVAQIATAGLSANGATIATSLNVANASVVGLGLSPVFVGSGFYSGPTLAIGGLLIAPRPATLKWVSAITKYVASTASVAFDFKVNGVSVFANATTAPAISAGGTFVSIASIANTGIVAGAILQGDILSVGANGAIQEVSIIGGTN